MKKIIILIIGLLVLVPTSIYMGFYFGFWLKDTSYIDWKGYHIELGKKGFTYNETKNGDLVLLGLKDEFYLQISKKDASPTKLLNLHAENICKTNECIFNNKESYLKEIPSFTYSKNETPPYNEINIALEKENIFITANSALPMKEFDPVIRAIVTELMGSPVQ